MNQTFPSPSGRREGQAFPVVSEIRVELQNSPRGGRVATVCHDNADKLNVIDRKAPTGIR